MDNGGAGGRSANGGPSWDIWDQGNWSATASSHHAVASSSTPSCSRFPDHTVVPGGGSIRCGGDHHHHHHHLTCLKLGKRQYYGGEGIGASGMKRERPPPSGPVPRCQVEGCNKALVDAKEYHRRHKVCEAHSKAPRVVVLGAEQRFCQQCSRFHAIREFDESKRSCRRRLAGHNERRRKGSGSAAGATANDSIIRSSESTVMGSGFTYESSPGCALSLLSSKASPWVSTSDLPSRSSAALRELIVENRAALLARQLISDRGSGWRDVDSRKQAAVVSYTPHVNQVQYQAPAQLTNGWNQFQDAGAHLTVDLMQMPGSSVDILSGKRERGLL